MWQEMPFSLEHWVVLGIAACSSAIGFKKRHRVRSIDRSDSQPASPQRTYVWSKTIYCCTIVFQTNYTLKEVNTLTFVSRAISCTSGKSKCNFLPKNTPQRHHKWWPHVRRSNCSHVICLPVHKLAMWPGWTIITVTMKEVFLGIIRRCHFTCTLVPEGFFYRSEAAIEILARERERKRQSNISFW